MEVGSTTDRNKKTPSRVNGTCNTTVIRHYDWSVGTAWTCSFFFLAVSAFSFNTGGLAGVA